MHSKEFIQRMKEKLLDEKERLTEELNETPKHTEVDTDTDDDELYAEIDEVNKDIISQLKKDLVKIDQALAKIEKGKYGICSVDGKEITESRLEVIPWADTCSDH